MEKIKEIEKKIENLKNKKNQATSHNSNINGKFYSMAVNISLELITGIGLGVILGLMVDNYLQTKPIMFMYKYYYNNSTLYAVYMYVYIYVGKKYERNVSKNKK